LLIEVFDKVQFLSKSDDMEYNLCSILWVGRFLHYNEVRRYLYWGSLESRPKRGTRPYIGSCGTRN